MDPIPCPQRGKCTPADIENLEESYLLDWVGHAADGMRKQLVLCTRSPDDLAAVRAAMAATMDAPLGLAPLDTTSALIPPVDSGDLVACAAFDQREVAMSRKQSMPLFAAALASGPPS